MAFTDLEYHSVSREIELFVGSIRSPLHLRSKIEIVYRITNQTINIGELRLFWRRNTGETSILPVAKITFIRSGNIWKLYWMHGNVKWEFHSDAASLAEALNMVRADSSCCFWG